MKLLIVLIAIKIVQSKIVIEIFTDNENPTISYTGTGTQNATPRGIENLYYIDKSTMKDFISDYYNSTRPRKVFYSTPTESKVNYTYDLISRDIYKRFNWDPVMLVTSIKSARKKYVREGKSLLFERIFRNPTNETKKVNAGIEIPGAITLETSWNTNNDLENKFNHDFVYDINVNFNEISGITHTNTFGEPSEVSEFVNIGRGNYEVELKPGQSVVAKFTARACNLAMKVTFETAVTGNLAVNFKEAVNGRHWLGPKIEDVLKNVNQSSVSSVEENLIIKLYYYYAAKVELFDKVTGLTLLQMNK